MIETAKQKLKNRKIAFFGKFAIWPRYHGGSPQTVAQRMGAILHDRVDSSLNILVLGDLRGSGRADAKKKAERLRRVAEKNGVVGVEILDEAAFRELVRFDVAGKSFCFFGNFDCCPKDFDENLLASMVSSAKGVVTHEVDPRLDFLVLGNRRGPGKTAAERTAQELMAAGHELTILNEDGFLELVRNDVAADGEMTFASLISRLYGLVNEKKLQRALKMLQTERFELYSHISSEGLSGVVKSQTQDNTVYAPWLNAKGQYGCYSHELTECMGLQGAICKHLLVLVIGLARTNQIPFTTAAQWIGMASSKRPKANDERSTDALLQYKGVIAGEIDWRPTETVPEDFYAL